MQWQYRSVNLTPGTSAGMFKNRLDAPALDAILNRLGNERWELIEIFTLSGEMSREVVAIMKRPLNPTDAVCETRGACPACGYDLRGKDHSMCPECGWSGNA